MFEHIEIETYGVLKTGSHTNRKTKTYPPHQVISIGRKKGNEISFNYPFLSKNHGAIYYVNETLIYEDFSSDGTILSREGKTEKIHRKRIKFFVGDSLEFIKDGIGFVIKILSIKEKN